MFAKPKATRIPLPKGRFILSRDCRKLLAGNGLAAIYPTLFRAYVEQFNWSYRDRFPELRFIQRAFLFTLYLLMRYGDTWRPHEFYEDSFLHAFPAVLDEIPPNPVMTPEEEIRSCYTWRTLVHFAGFPGDSHWRGNKNRMLAWQHCWPPHRPGRWRICWSGSLPRDPMSAVSASII